MQPIAPMFSCCSSRFLFHFTRRALAAFPAFLCTSLGFLLFSLIPVVDVVTAGEHRLQWTSATLERFAVPRDPDTSADGRAQSQIAQTATGFQVILPLLLEPLSDLDRIQAPVPLRNLGTSHYHGYTIAHVALTASERKVVEAAGGFDFTTRPVATRPARIQRAHALRSLRVRREVQALVANPEALALYPETNLVRKAHATLAFAPTETPSLEGSAVEMLILTRESLAESFHLYAEARTAMGTPTIVRTVEWVSEHYPHGADLQETLRGFIRDAYELWGIQYLLLGGDTSIIPTRFARSDYTGAAEEVPTDLYYACLDGDWNADGDANWGEGYVAATNSTDMADLYPELYLGRLPVETPTQVAEYLAKLMDYLEPQTTDYQDKILLMAEVLWPANYTAGSTIFKNGADNAERLIFLNDLQENHALTKLYETPEKFSNASMLTQLAGIHAMNEGFGLVSHFGHGFRYTMSLGNVSLTNVQAAGLNNEHRPFFLTMLNCSATAYDFPCLAEEFLLNANGGAVGVIGASREAFPDNVQIYQEAWYDGIFQQDQLASAQALHHARLRLLSNTFEDNAFRWTNFITAYLGDPKIDIWRGKPRVASVIHPSSSTLGTQNLNLQVSSAGRAVAGATVCLWKKGDFYAVARTNYSGQAQLDFRVESAGSIAVTVSGAGLLPYRGSINVAASAGVALRATGNLIVDDASAGSVGNGNGLMEASEEVLLQVELKNEGGVVADEVTLLAQTSDPFVVLPEPFVAVGTVLPGQSLLAPPLPVRISDLALDRHQVVIDLSIQSRGWVWDDRIQVNILQAEPRLTGLIVEDANRNGRPEPDETYDLVAEIKNYGFGTLDGSNVTLFSSDPQVIILEGNASLGSVAHLETGSVVFTLKETDVSEPNSMLLVLVNPAGRSWSFPIETRRPEPPVQLQADPSPGPHSVLLSWQSSPSGDVAGYHVYRSSKQVGPWVRANKDLIESTTSFLDDGLEGSTRYSYVAVAVDASGNRSDFSNPAELVTNPVQNAGWPQRMGQWSNCPPLVADLDGDLQFEVLAASDHVYAWNSSGNELRDGDQNPATHGIWSSAGFSFVAGLAAGDLDADGFEEIVACSWDTREVYVLDGDGSVLPGWPRPIASTAKGIWATPALGDLDLDERLEVIVLGLDGRLYAWHADGSEVLDGDHDPTTPGVFFAIPESASWSRGAPVVADILRDDATPEIVFGARNNKIYMLRADGSTPAGWPRTVGNEVTASPALGDIDGDGELEIAVPAMDGSLYVLNADGSDLEGWPRPFETHWIALTPSVALHDFDADGHQEIVVAGSTGPTSNGELWIYDWQGNVLPGWPVDVGTASEASPVIGDLDGDGTPEILFGGETGILYGFALDGTPAPGFPIELGAELRATPVLTDVDRDGDIDVVFAGWDQRVYIFDFKGLYVRNHVPWPMFKGNSLRNGLQGYRNPTDSVEEGRVPRQTRLHANVPNPFNPMTRIRFEIAGSSVQRVRLLVFDVQGRLVRTLVNEKLPPGLYSEAWNGRDDSGRPSSSGVYFYRLETPDYRAGHKMILVR